MLDLFHKVASVLAFSSFIVFFSITLFKIIFFAYRYMRTGVVSEELFEDTLFLGSFVISTVMFLVFLIGYVLFGSPVYCGGGPFWQCF